MSNVIAFNKSKDKDVNVQKPIDVQAMRKVISIAANDPVAKQARMLFRPKFLDEKTLAMFKKADLSNDSFLNVILLMLENSDHRELFPNNEIIDLLDQASQDVINLRPVVFTLNFEDEIFSISLIPLNNLWVLIDAFLGSESLLQDSIDDACESMSIHREELSIV